PLVRGSFRAANALARASPSPLSRSTVIGSGDAENMALNLKSRLVTSSHTVGPAQPANPAKATAPAHCTARPPRPSCRRVTVALPAPPGACRGVTAAEPDAPRGIPARAGRGQGRSAPPPTGHHLRISVKLRLLSGDGKVKLRYLTGLVLDSGPPPSDT